MNLKLYLTAGTSDWNAGTLIVSAVLVIIVGLVAYKMIKDKKSGKSTCSCGGSCSGCGMAGSCHNTKNDGIEQPKDGNYIKKITLRIDGMMCGMCESHINDAIRSHLNVKKLKTSHTKGTSEFLTNDVVSDESLHSIIEKTGYKLIDITREFQL